MDTFGLGSPNVLLSIYLHKYADFQRANRVVALNVKNGFNMSQWERSGAISVFGSFQAPRLPEWLLADSTMTFRGRSDGLVVESDRKKKSFSRRQCVALIAFMDKPPLNYIVEMNISLQNIRWGVNISGISSVACWVCDCVCVGVLKVSASECIIVTW